MTLQYTPLILPLLLSGGISGGLGIYAYRHRRSHEGVLPFALMSFACAVWALGDALTWASAELAWQSFWFDFRRLGIEGAAFFWFVFAARYTGWNWLTRKRLALVAVVPIAGVLLAWTNPWHHLVTSGVRQVDWNGTAALVVSRGGLWPMLLLYVYVETLGGAALIIAALVRAPELYRGQLWPLLTAVALPFAASIPDTLHPTPLDPIPFALCMSGIALAWAVFRRQLLDLAPAARHTIIENMSDAMLVLDRSHRVVDLNPAARRLVATPGANAIGLPLVDLLPESARSLGAAISGVDLREAEVALDGRDYELRISPVRNKDGAVTGRVLLLHDITEQKQTREMLRQTEETSRTILESIEDGYYEIDLTGTFTRVTEPTARIIGLPREDVIGRSMRELTDDETVDRLAVVYDQVRETGVALKQLEYTLTGRDGKTRHLEASASLIRNAAGEPVGFRGIVRDTTERKRAEQELQEAKRIAEEASRAKGAFLATVSHELRTPLTSMLGFAKLIKKRLGDVIVPALAGADAKAARALQQVHENVDIIVAEGERLTTLINDVLDLAKIESGKVEWHMQPLAVSDIIQHAVAATTSLSAAKGLEVRTEIAEALPTVIGDPDRLIQVVINLLSNAIKFTDAGSITCRARRGDSAIEVTVTDTGTGISPEDQPKVFEQFVQVGDTLTGKPTGTGLGLPICKQIIEHHGGRIWVESDVGRGSTFAFTLPLERDAAEQADTAIEPQRVELQQLLEQLRQRLSTLEPTHGEARTVLIVDDDPSIRSLLRQELEASGHEVREARSGEEALAAIEERHPGLIILDVIMPGLSGFDVAALLRSDPRTLNIPVIILSVVQDRQRGLRLGVDQYFIKPVSSEVLLQEVDALLTRGPAKKKVLVVDEDAATVRTLSDALAAQGYEVTRAYSGPDGIARAVADHPDLVLVRSLLCERHSFVQSVRFHEGMEAVSFLLFE
jgi:PAS domain S-box-containing protein